MNANKQAEFADLLVATLELYGAKLTPAAISLWTAALRDYDFEAVKAALSRHVQTPGSGKFAPKPADVIELLQGDDGRPGPEAAWALCPKSEADTAVWTPEVAQAFFEAALPLLETGDEIGARMAFRERYTGLLSQARARRAPVLWGVSPGSDKRRRDEAINTAVEHGRLSREAALKHLPHLRDDGQASEDVKRLLDAVRLGKSTVAP